MRYPEKIVSIKKSDNVLEIGPGSNPFSRANVFLERKYDSDNDWYEQNGLAKPKKLINLVLYNGGEFPFKDKEFDYVVCSHVLEHVEDVELFIEELQRISIKGYIEFPTIYYEYIYNFKVHLQYLFYDGEKIQYLPKREYSLNEYKFISLLFYKALEINYDERFNKMFKKFFFQGFEWKDTIIIERAKLIEDLCFDSTYIEKELHKLSNEKHRYDDTLFTHIKKGLKRRFF